MSHVHLGSAIRKELEKVERVKVTIAGLEELNSTKGLANRLFWTFVLLAMAGLAAKDFATLAIRNLHGGTGTDLQLELDQQSLGLSNLTICVQTTYNISKLMETLVVPPEAWRRIQKMNWTTEEIFREFSQFLLQNSFNQPNYSNPLQRIFWLLLAEESNSDILEDPHYLIKHYLPSCQRVVVSCTFAQKPYDCCKDSVISFADSSVCYKFVVNPDEKDVFRQTSPGPDGGFSVDIVTDTTSSFYIDDITSDGLYVYTQNAACPLSIPVVVTADTHLYLRLTVKRRILLKNCHVNPPKLQFLDYYDPDGLACIMDGIAGLIHEMIDCFLQFPPVFPNISETCSAVYANKFMSLINQGQEAFLYSNPGDADNGTIQKRVVDLMKRSGISLDNFQPNQFLKLMPQCKPLCTSWQYDTILSFASLVDNDFENDFKNRTFFQNRITLYYGGFDYRIETEIPTISNDVLFAQIGSIIGLYGGSSVVTLVQVVIYGIGKISRLIYGRLFRFCCTKWQRRRLTVVELL